MHSSTSSAVPAEWPPQSVRVDLLVEAPKLLGQPLLGVLTLYLKVHKLMEVTIEMGALVLCPEACQDGIYLLKLCSPPPLQCHYAELCTKRQTGDKVC
jgi:hypothetical protein